MVSITNYGAFIELEKGIEGLVHISEMSWTRNVRHPSKIVSIGETIEAVVLKVDESDEKISLGMKQIEQDPWMVAAAEVSRSAPGSPARCATSLRSAPSWRSSRASTAWSTSPTCRWTKRVEHPSEVVKKGDTVDVVILNIDARQQADLARPQAGHR